VDQLPYRTPAYTAANKAWTLYWRDRNRRFHLYDQSLLHQTSKNF
jgi:hypothetical protein